ncbi:MAG TPA: hypothetical protein VG672_07045 [Bryobacteraceae bacterium]|nr:hypothetical protein [Bryobacteraceae bacterium]
MKRLIPLLSLAAVNGWAQCVMCFRTAEAQSAARAKLLNLGILILGAPPFVIRAGVCFLIYRRNHSYAARDRSEEKQPQMDADSRR